MFGCEVFLNWNAIAHPCGIDLGRLEPSFKWILVLIDIKFNGNSANLAPIVFNSLLNQFSSGWHILILLNEFWSFVSNNSIASPENKYLDEALSL